MNNYFTVSWHLHGTLAANASMRWVAPFDCQLIHVQSVASNNSDATLIVGTTSDDDGYLTSHTVGDSGVPSEKGRTDFTGALVSPTGQYPHIADGTVVMVTLDFDGAAGTAAQNVTITLTFTPG